MAAAASRAPTLAIATAAAISMYAGTAYALSRDVKHKEGKGSLYQPVDEKKTIGKAGDSHLSPKAIHEVVSKAKERVKPS